MVGVGAVGRHHARVASRLKGAVCAGVFDIDRGRGEAVARELGVRAWQSLEELLADSDGVVVAVPTSAHEEVAAAAIRAGVHVFVEKPLAPDVAGADRILAEARARGALVQVGHVERFNPAVVAARPHLDRPLFVESHRLAPFAPRSLDVAVVLDLMIHDIDLLCTLLREPVVEVAAVGVPVLSRRVDVASARLVFEGGAVANLTASRVSAKKVRKLRVWQRSGYLSLDLAAGSGEFYRLKRGLAALEGAGAPGAAAALDGVAAPGRAAALEGPPAPPALDGLSAAVERIAFEGVRAEPLAAEQAAFRDAIAGVAPPPVSGQDGRRALELALAIEKQIEEHVAHTRSSSS